MDEPLTSVQNRPVPGLAGKTAVVFGGASGIGLATANVLANAGARVAIVDLDGAMARVAVDGIAMDAHQVAAWSVDSSDEAAVTDAVMEIVDWGGSLDVSVMSVYHDRRAPVVELARSDWDRVLDVTLTSGYSIARACLPHMVQGGGGSLIFISSLQARFGLPDSPAYSAAKAGLCGLVRQIAVQYGRWGIRANAILPSAVLVDRNRVRWENPVGGVIAVRHAFPLGRIGKPVDVAEAALFLASDASSFITGIELPVDGGLSVCPATLPMWDVDQSELGREQGMGSSGDDLRGHRR